jgi:para-aminobenzoate synthetase/4-amino-4-deoxychorismate lyase
MDQTKHIYPDDFNLVESILWESCCGFWLLPEHLERLKKSVSYFDFQLNEEELQKSLDIITQGLEPSPHLIHVLVDKQGGLSLKAEPTIEERTPYRANLADYHIDRANIFIQHNTSNRDIYNAALASCPEYDDVILWNETGEITETCTGNIVVKIEEIYFTPPVSSGLLPGTYRAHLLNEKRLFEKIIQKDQINTFDKIFTVNSRVGWRELILDGI